MMIINNLPVSKSIANRALLLAALANGVTTLRGNWGEKPPEDITLMRAALVELGAKIKTISEREWQVTGVNGKWQAGKHQLYLGNAGTATRFLAAAAGFCDGQVIIDGSERMQKRPIGDLIQALQQIGVNIKSKNNNNCPPLVIRSDGKIKGGDCDIRGDISSQFISALLLITNKTEQSVNLKITSELSSKPYVELTKTIIKNWQNDYTIEPDSSAAAHVFALAVGNEPITIPNFKYNGLQGDSKIVDVYTQMGAIIKFPPCEGGIKGGLTISFPKILKPITINLAAMPDAAMQVVVLAALAQGKSVISGLHTLPHKECNRLQALAENLERVGIKTKTTDESITVYGNPDNLQAAEIKCYDDHRIAMSFAALKLRCPKITFDQPECVAKTFPNFWQIFKQCKKT